jgi:Family of unknown function (DUF6294)
MNARHTLGRIVVGFGAVALAAVAGIAPASAATGDQKERQPVATPAAAAGARALIASSRSFTWGTLHYGDCQQENGTLTLRSDGTADFSAVTLTYQTHTHDVWWSTFRFSSPSGTLLFTSPTLRSPDMSDGNPPPRYRMTGHFSFDPVYYAATSRVFQSYNC